MKFYNEERFAGHFGTRAPQLQPPPPTVAQTKPRGGGGGVSLALKTLVGALA